MELLAEGGSTYLLKSILKLVTTEGNHHPQRNDPIKGQLDMSSTYPQHRMEEIVIARDPSKYTGC